MFLCIVVNSTNICSGDIFYFRFNVLSMSLFFLDFEIKSMSIGVCMETSYKEVLKCKNGETITKR